MKTKKCILCDKKHEVVIVLNTFPVMICPLIKDLIYINCTIDKASREIIKKELGL